MTSLRKGDGNGTVKVQLMTCEQQVVKFLERMGRDRKEGKDMKGKEI